MVRYLHAHLCAAMIALVFAAVVLAADAEEARAQTTVAIRGCDGVTVRLTSAERTMLNLHNRYRAEHGRPRFCVHPKLQRAARAHSQEEIARQYYGHNSYNGETAGARLRRYGYNWSYFGENIAFGHGQLNTPQYVFGLWTPEPGQPHSREILDSRRREIGVGAATGTYKDYGPTTMWTVDFGARRR